MKPLLSSLVRLNSIHPFAKVRLIALDIDGTLAISGDSATAEFVRHLTASLRRLGVLVTVATGRAFAGAQPIIENLSNKGAPVVLYNGAVVAERRGGAVYYRATISPQTVEALAEITRVGRGIVQAYNCRPRQHSIVDTSGKGLEETVVGWARDPGAELDLNGLPIEWRPYGDYHDITEANAALLAVDAGSRAIMTAGLQSLPEITTTSSGRRYIEIRPAGVTKAGMSWLRDHLSDLLEAVQAPLVGSPATMTAVTLGRRPRLATICARAASQRSGRPPPVVGRSST